jgi:uncharacterized SAM-binding protein YcdF (DUF218 family)
MEFWPRIAETFLTPPGIVIVLLILTLLAYFRKHWLGTGMLVLSIIILVAMSLPRTGQVLLGDLQGFARPPELVPMADSGPQASVYAPKDSLKDPPQAIVVLGAKRTPEAPEYDFQDTLGPAGLERVRYGAYLQHKTRVPILVSGGSPGGETVSEAAIMKAVLEDEFKTSVKWVESQSRNTMENARFSQALLAEARIKHVYLVTHAWHMRRAARAFESVGIQVTPAPTGFQALTRGERTLGADLPSSWGMHLTSLAIRERLSSYWASLSDEPIAKPAAGR